MKRVLGALSVISMGLTACDGKVRFNQIDIGSKQQVTAPPTPVVPDPVFLKSQGSCATDSSTSVASCMKCEIPPLPPVEPPMSLKARQLMTIMTAVCPINNAYYGNRYFTLTVVHGCSVQELRQVKIMTILFFDSIYLPWQNESHIGKVTH